MIHKQIFSLPNGELIAEAYYPADEFYKFDMENHMFPGTMFEVKETNLNTGEWKLYNSETNKTEEGKSRMPVYVKVKIAVAVDPKGNWVSAGWVSADDRDLMDSAVEDLESGEARYWVTAELEIPEIKETKEIEASKIEKESE
jgi:hypothetical protein